MNTNTIITFINKAIEKTKSGELDWFTLPKDYSIKPVPDALDSPDHLLLGHSYKASYKTGELLLLVFSIPLNKTKCPPDGCALSLRVQDNKSKFAVEITNSQLDPVDATALFRLYNLIDMESSSVSLLVNDFLNS